MLEGLELNNNNNNNNTNNNIIINNMNNNNYYYTNCPELYVFPDNKNVNRFCSATQREDLVKLDQLLETTALLTPQKSKSKFIFSN